mmetsp:Transcript_2098/g.4720  ORF Transcript_2098/g.4720 Transcript_2098/m.4720 type:complete len:215 (-) Transcript_2098:224-868(-)
MDNSSVALLLAPLHRHPHFGHPRASGVNDLHLPLLEVRHLVDRCAERGQHHDVALLDTGEVLPSTRHRLHEPHAHVGQVLVHQRVVDDLIGDPDLLVREEVPCLVSHGYSSLNTPAEAVGLRKHEGDVAQGQAEAVLSHVSHELAAADIEQLLHGVFHLCLAELVVLLRPAKFPPELLRCLAVNCGQHCACLGPQHTQLAPTARCPHRQQGCSH